MRYAVVVVAGLLLFGCSGPAATGGTSSAASCVAPQLSAAPASAAPGTKVHVTGRYFFDDCHDTVVNGQPRQEPRPLTDLVVLLRQGDRSWTLAEHVSAAGTDFAIDTEVTVPPDIGSGAAVLMVPGHGDPVVLTVSAPAEG